MIPGDMAVLQILVRTERPKNNLNISVVLFNFFRCYVGENDERSIEDCAERDKQNPSTDPKEKTKSVSELKEWVCSKYDKTGMHSLHSYRIEVDCSSGQFKSAKLRDK